jgi:uncharacterized MnhB-related membrane protein
MQFLTQTASLALSFVALGAAILVLFARRPVLILVSLALLSLSIVALLALMGAPQVALVQGVLGTLGSVGFIALTVWRFEKTPAPQARFGLRELDTQSPTSPATMDNG